MEFDSQKLVEGFENSEYTEAHKYLNSGEDEFVEEWLYDASKEELEEMVDQICEEGDIDKDVVRGETMRHEEAMERDYSEKDVLASDLFFAMKEFLEN